MHTQVACLVLDVHTFGDQQKYFRDTYGIALDDTNLNSVRAILRQF